MARSKQTGPLVGNYVTFRLTNNKAVANNDTRVLQQRFFLPMGFRVSELAFDALGQTATVTAFVDNGSTSANIGSAVVSSGTPKTVLTDALTQANRNIPKDGSIDLTVTADGTGAAAIGTIAVFVTGYFTSHIVDYKSSFAEAGQATMTGPAAGYYNNFPMINLRSQNNQSMRTECSLICPHDCRIMAVGFDAPGTYNIFTTGAVHYRITTPAGVVVNNGPSGSVGEVHGRVTSFGGFVLDSTKCDLLKGDLIQFGLQTGLNDTLNVGGVFANILVWVKGHVSATLELD